MNALTSLPILERLGLKGRKPNSPPSAADYAGALDRAERQREAAASSLAALAEERASLLLVGDDGALDAIEQRQQAAAREMDRLDAAIGELERRYETTIAAEQAAGRAKLVQQHGDAVNAAVTKLHGALLAAESAADALREVVAEAEVDGVRECAPVDLLFRRRLSAADIAEWAAAARAHFDPPVKSAPSADSVTVRYVEKFSPYNVGEISGCKLDLARRLLDAGMVVLVHPHDASKLPPPAPDYATEPLPPAGPSGNVKVIFLRQHLVGSFGSHNPGEMAGFLPATAEGLVRGGIARFAPGQGAAEIPDAA